MSTSERIALFSGGGRSSTTSSKALVEFRAGKMNMNGTLVTPDKRKGMVMVEQGQDDQLMHFKWKDRTSGNIEEDLIIFPDDVEFKKVSQCTTGRVFILKFKSSSRKLFFWMQEPKDDKDEEYCKKVNDYLNNPPAPGSSSSRGGSIGGSGGSGGGIPGLDLSNLGDSELQSLLSNLSQSQMAQLFGVGGSGLAALTNAASGGSSGSRQRSNAGNTSSSTTTAAATTASTTTTTSATTATSATKSSDSSSANIRLSDLQNVLSGLPSAGGSSGPNVDLSSGLSTEVLQPLLENPEFVRKMKELLPEEEQAQDDATGQVRGTLQSPQFRQALGMFSSGLQTGQLAPLIREFNLGQAAIDAATKGDMEAFVKALQNNKKSPTTESAGDKKTEGDDDGMALD